MIKNLLCVQFTYLVLGNIYIKKILFDSKFYEFVKEKTFDFFLNFKNQTKNGGSKLFFSEKLGHPTTNH